MLFILINYSIWTGAKAISVYNNIIRNGGNKSINIQAGGNIQAGTIIHSGVSYDEAKEIALDIFKANFYQLSEIAHNEARKRAEEITDKFLCELKKSNPEAINSIKNPDMQYALFSVQREYAKYGDKDLEEMLVDILVDRANNIERNLKQIVLDESLSVVPKLTTEQLDALSVIFLITRTIFYNLNNLENLKQFVNNWLKPFITNLSKESSCYEHLVYAGCGLIGIGSVSIEKVFLSNYGGLFCNGFTLEEYEKDIGERNDINMLTRCLNNPNKFQINALNEKKLDDICKSKNFEAEKIAKLKGIFNKYLKKGDEVRRLLINQDNILEKLFDVWDNSSIRNFKLTSVGIAIAQANIRRKVGERMDLSIWIK